MGKIILDGMGLQEGENIKIGKAAQAPIVCLNENIVIDDSVLEKPTLMIGQVASGKSSFLKNKFMPQIFSTLRDGDSAVIFAAKNEMIDGFYNPNKDILLDFETTDPSNIWNIFQEMSASAKPELCLSELADVLFSGHDNKTQPFFSNAAKDTFKAVTLYLYNHYEKRTGKKPTTSTLLGFFNKLEPNDREIEGRKKKGLLTLIQNEEELHYLSTYFGDCSTAQALGVWGELRCVLQEVFQGGAFIRAGSFSVHEAMSQGKRIFLRYDYSMSTPSTLLYFDMILDQCIKFAMRDDMKKTWFILDEFSLLGSLRYLQSAMAFGRANGFRLLAAMQSVQLMSNNYSEAQTQSILGLFPNIFCFFTTDANTREFMKKRYGTNLVSLTGVGKGTAELIQGSVIEDADFYKISLPGDCIASISGYTPFFLRTHKTQ